MNFKKLGRAIFICHYSLQILKVSCDLEILVDFVVEIPWNTPLAVTRGTYLGDQAVQNPSFSDK